MIQINGKQFETAAGQTILEVARANRIGIPTLCHDPRVKPQGNCGLCIVEIDGGRQMKRACATEAVPGMVINTESPRVKNARRVLLEMMLSNHIGDCRAPCMLACPAQTDCQGYIALIANGQYKEAASLAREKVPIPSAIGRICPRPCEAECRRKLVDEPINIAAMKAFAGDFGEPAIPEAAADTGKKAAVIGGGPAGLTAAYFLRLRGHEVSIYDAMPKMGGMLRYGIPEYRLPKKVLDREISFIENLGIAFKNNVKVGRDVSLSSLRDRYGAVIVAIGAWKSSSVRCTGEERFTDDSGILGGVEFLRNPINIEGKQIAVIGGGFTAMDVARTAIRFKAAKVSMVYRRTKAEMPAADEYEEALEEGVIFRFLEAPVEILGDEHVSGLRVQKMVLGAPDASGRRSPVVLEGQEEVISADYIITAIGQALDADGLEALPLNSWGAVAQTHFRTALPGVFAVGDAVNKGDIAVEAVGHAQKAVPAVHRYLMGMEWDSVDIEPEPPYVRSVKTEADFAGRPILPRQNAEFLPPTERIKSFTEASKGLTEEQVAAEARRCLACGCADFFECRLFQLSRQYSASPLAFKNPVQSAGRGDASHPYFDREPNKCILCGLCARGCEELVGQSVLSVVRRGYTSTVTTAYDGPISETNCVGCGQCILMCPTGALMERLPMVVDEEKVHSVCSMCSAGCPVIHTYKGDMPLRTLPDGDGLLCRMGRFSFGHMKDMERLSVPLLNGEEVTAEEAVCYMKEGLQDIVNRYGEDSVGVAVGGQFTNEDIAAVIGWVKKTLPKAKIFSFDGLEALDTAKIEPLTKEMEGLGLMKYCNSRGLMDLGVRKFDGEKVSGLLVFGETTGLPDLPNIEFLAVVDSVVTDVAKTANVALPGITFAETSGTYTSAMGKVNAVNAVVSPSAGFGLRQWVERF